MFPCELCHSTVWNFDVSPKCLYDDSSYKRQEVIIICGEYRNPDPANIHGSPGIDYAAGRL